MLLREKIQTRVQITDDGYIEISQEDCEGCASITLSRDQLDDIQSFAYRCREKIDGLFTKEE